MNPNEYKCSQCGGVFESGWSEEEAQDEVAENGWAEIDACDMAGVCDDCYTAVMAWAQRFTSLTREQ